MPTTSRFRELAAKSWQWQYLCIGSAKSLGRSKTAKTAPLTDECPTSRKKRPPNTYAGHLSNFDRDILLKNRKDDLLCWKYRATLWHRHHGTSALSGAPPHRMQYSVRRDERQICGRTGDQEEALRGLSVAPMGRVGRQATELQVLSPERPLAGAMSLKPHTYCASGCHPAGSQPEAP